MTIAEGKLPKDALDNFPVPSGPLTAWQLPSVPSGLKGDIKLEFDSKKPQGAGEFVLYFFAGNVWKTAEVRTGGCGGKLCHYSAFVPYSLYYAVAVK